MLPQVEGIKLAAKGAWAAGKAWIILAVFTLVFAFGAFAGSRWEKGETQEALRLRDEATRSAQAWKDESNARKVVIDRWEAQAAESKRRAREQAEQAARVLDKLQVETEKAKAREEDWRRRYEAAKRSPDCAELMKATTCPAFSGY